jgi:hypothetical protein
MTFLSFALIGFLVAAGITTRSYYTNSTPGSDLMNPILLLIACPPALLLIATEHASVSVQALIITLTLMANGVIYGVAAMSVRQFFDKDER